MGDMTPCKICGDPHYVDSYKGMRFYVCPRTNKVYLLSEEKRDVQAAVHMGEDQGSDLGDAM